MERWRDTGGGAGAGKALASIHTRVHTPSRPVFFLEKQVRRVIAFFRSDQPVFFSRARLGAVLVIGVLTPLVLALSAVVFSSHRRWRKP